MSGASVIIPTSRFLEFVCHPLHELIQVHSGGQAKSLRSAKLRWLPDKFERKVVESHREVVMEAAWHVARILTAFRAKMRECSSKLLGGEADTFYS